MGANLQKELLWKDEVFLSESSSEITLEAATKPVGFISRTSLAKLGPERKAVGCLLPSTWGISSDIIRPVPSSRPLLTEIMGTSFASTSCRKMACHESHEALVLYEI